MTSNGSTIQSGTGTTAGVVFLDAGTFVVSFSALNSTLPSGCTLPAMTQSSVTQPVGPPCALPAPMSLSHPLPLSVLPVGSAERWTIDGGAGADLSWSIRWDGGVVHSGTSPTITVGPGVFSSPGDYNVTVLSQGTTPSGCVSRPSTTQTLSFVQSIDACPGASAIRDDFRTGRNAAVWNVITNAPGSSVTASDGGIAITNRGYLITTREFPAANGPLRILAEFTATPTPNSGFSPDDIIAIHFRFSNALTASHEPTATLSCLLQQSGGSAGAAGLFLRNGSMDLRMPIGNIFSRPLVVGDRVIMEIFDDGANVSCRARLAGTTSSRTLEATTAGGSSQRYVAFSNREQRSNGAINQTAIVDNVVIEQGVSALPFTQWNFEDVVGPTVYSAAPDAGLTGTLTGLATVAPGFLGNSLTLNGRTDEGVVLDPAQPNPGTASFSISYWFQTPDNGNKPLTDLVTNRTTVGPGNFVESRLLRNASGSSVAFGAYDNQVMAGNQVALSSSPTGNVADGGWHHVVGMRDGIVFRLFVDGVQVQSGLPNLNPVINLSAVAPGFGAGRAPSSGAGREFSGQLDDVRFYDTAIPACGVRALSARP